jgi:hypothetical protein
MLGEMRSFAVANVGPVLAVAAAVSGSVGACVALLLTRAEAPPGPSDSGSSCSALAAAGASFDGGVEEEGHAALAAAGVSFDGGVEEEGHAPRRLRKAETVLRRRTSRLVLVLEGSYDLHNQARGGGYCQFDCHSTAICRDFR